MPRRPAGTIYVPKSEAFLLDDLVQVMVELYGDRKTKVRSIGRRPGEKLHEELISVEELSRTTDKGDHFVVEPKAVRKPITVVPSSNDYVMPRAALKKRVRDDLKPKGRGRR